MTVAHTTTPYENTYQINEPANTFTNLSNPATLPASTGQGASFSADGNYMAVAGATSPFVNIYQITSGPTFTKLANPATLPPGNAFGVAFSPQ
jgi:hypothetical protein